MRRTTYAALSVIALALITVACDDPPKTTSDHIQTAQQETLLKEATSQIGMPGIKNFREKKLLKDILELRDQDGLVTYTYTFAENSGKLTLFCESIGYGIPYATQFTAPQKLDPNGWHGNGGSEPVVPQADPNALFSPAAAEGTWVLCADPTGGKKTLPVYLEPRIIVSPFRLKTAE
jgi:hypothetical protein